MPAPGRQADSGLLGVQRRRRGAGPPSSRSHVTSMRSPTTGTSPVPPWSVWSRGREHSRQDLNAGRTRHCAHALDLTPSDTHGSPTGATHHAHFTEEETEAQVAEVASTPRCALPGKVSVKAL